MYTMFGKTKMNYKVMYIPKIEDEVAVAQFETKQEADAHMEHIAKVKPTVLPFHYIKETK